MYESIMLLGHRYAGGQQGSIATITAIAALPLLLAAGAATDYIRAWDVRTELQAAVDSAALGGAAADTDLNSVKTEHALSYFARFALFSSITPVITFSGSSVTVTADHKVPTSFMSLAGIKEMNLKVTATAVTVTKPVCILALNETAASAMHLLGSTANIHAPDCVVHSNSSDDRSLDNTSNTVSIAETFCTVGGFRGDSFNPTPRTQCRKVRDPYAGLSKPAVSGCDFTSEKRNGGSSALYPGIYCGGLSISGSATVAFEPGVYVMKDGPLNISGTGGSIEGVGVSFYFVGNKATLSLSGGADIRLTAPAAGAYKGLIFVQDANNSPSETNKVTGGTNIRLVGVAYFPNQTLDVSGNGNFGVQSPYMAFVADKLQFSGNGKLHMTLDAKAAGFLGIVPQEYWGTRLVN